MYEVEKSYMCCCPLLRVFSQVGCTAVSDIYFVAFELLVATAKSNKDDVVERSLLATLGKHAKPVEGC